MRTAIIVFAACALAALNASIGSALASAQKKGKGTATHGEWIADVERPAQGGTSKWPKTKGSKSDGIDLGGWSKADGLAVDMRQPKPVPRRLRKK